MNHPDQARLPETCASTQAGASSTTCACSVPAAPISSASPATWKPAAAPGAPSPGGYAPSRGSTATRSKKNSSTSLTRRTRPAPAAGRRVPRHLRRTVTSSARCWSPPGSAPCRAGADLPAGPQRATGLRSHWRGHRSHRHRARAPDTRGHPKGGKIVTIPLAPRTARAIDLAIGERCAGPVFLPRTAAGWTVTALPGSSARPPAAPGSPSPSGRTRCATRSSPRRSFDAGVPLRDVQEAASHADPRTTMRYDRARASLDRQHMPPTSSPPTSLVQRERTLGSHDIVLRPGRPENRPGGR